ncbi:gluconokinase [Luteolibacter ambystomatis]|uniref:Gluconokinase n=1 Tax=Luteolibacter ambystomatis TaxID=2824561 RepID=A0A975J2V9_9BACT|nr:gluconokinase [Luteolibacter ambystomatis]QUE53047.1 gluconokinase [Luteolibacter ambystomatis]
MTPRILLMGVSGSGKTTVGLRLADALGIAFLDADDFHPPANVAKMHAGIPLTDDDRAPWLAILAEKLRSTTGGCVLACSALKDAYRQILTAAVPDLRLFFLDGPPALIRHRLEGRSGHFMPASLLDSQFSTLEPPKDAIRLDIAEPVEIIVARILSHL